MKYSRYIKLARDQRKLLLTGVIAGIIAGVTSGFGVPTFVQTVFKNIFEDTSQVYSLGYLILIASLLPAVFLVRGIATYLNQYFLQWTVQNVLLEVRHQLFEKLQVLPIAYFEKRQSGDLMAKLVGDTLQVQQSILLVARDAFIQPFTFAAGMAYLIKLSVEQNQAGILLLILMMGPMLILPVRYIGKHLRRRSRELQGTLGELTEIMAENLRGVVEVRSFNLQEREKARFREKLTAYNRFAMKMAKYHHLSQPYMELISVTMVSIAFVYSYTHDIGFEVFLSIFAAVFLAADAIKRLVKMVNGLQKVSGSFERIETVLTEPDAVQDAVDPIRLQAPVGHLAFRDVRFSYNDEEEVPELEIQSLDIPLGSTCALVGPSGAGKSTFAKLIPRFYDPQSGQILFDGVDLRSLAKDQLRECVAFVPQATVLFNGSIRDNILLARPGASEEAIRDAARQAHAEDFILSFPEEYDTQVGENAIRLSGGQRQRLALARAFLKDAPILILDEATSALDAESEVKIQDALRTLARNRTILIIAHRFATIRMAESILLFENGKIRCHGNFATLMRDDLFRRLYEIQADGNSPAS